MLHFLRTWLMRKKHTKVLDSSVADDSIAQLPENLRIYAVGDIHGRLDLLDSLLGQISEECAQAPEKLKTQLIFLGDYIDRGPHSKEVIDRLLQPMPGCLQPIFLLGNHEFVFKSLFSDATHFAGWLQFGGYNTLLSYGVSCPAGRLTLERMTQIQEGLKEKVPASHHEFLSQLQLYSVKGDYLFVHAGVNPQKTFAEQTQDDYLWSRRGFLDVMHAWEKKVIHGHTIYPQVEVTPLRIGIDTGAYASDVLTALVLEGNQWRTLQTGPSKEIFSNNA